jgi:uncharacterized membrane protein
MASLTTTAAQTLQPIAFAEKKVSFRIGSIDLLRGLVMIIMALDHTRDFLHDAAWTDDPLNLATTTPVLFLTRWITHFCAPVFVFLAGTSIYFQSLRKSKKDLSIFLLTRGLWLIFIEIAVINLAFTFDITYSVVGLQTIWSIGISMIVMAAIIWLPFRLILSLGLLIVLGHNSLDFYEAGHKGGFDFFYSLVHRPGLYPVDASHGVLVLYPFLSWAGLMMMGYCFGKLFTLYEGAARKQMLLRLGFGVIAFFILLRAFDVYGDPGKWQEQNSLLYTLFSFISVQKYPPSLLYTCATIGPALLFLALAEGAKNRLSRIITVYGRVPFLYYVLHFFLIHIVATIFFFASGHSVATAEKFSGGLTPLFVIPGEGFSLLVVYAVWLGIVASLYPVCNWFSRYKQTHKQWWLSYL